MAITLLTAANLNIDSIIDKIELILTTLGLNLEDLSGVDPGAWTAEPLAELVYNGEAFFDTNGQQFNEASATFTVVIKFRETTPGASRQKSALWVHNLKYNITPDNINNPDKLVIEVFEQTGEVVDYETDVTTVNYIFNVRYRNEDG